MGTTQYSKKIIILLQVIIFCTSCVLFPKTEKIKCNNLFIVYMAGDNSLNKTIYSDFEELKTGVQKEDDIVLVLVDRFSSNLYEDEWNEARLFQISYKNEEVKVEELEEYN